MSAQTPQQGTEHEDLMSAWCDGVERRAAGAEHAVARGLGRRRVGTAAGAYRAEGRVQCAGQMDIWACLAEAAADETSASESDEQ